MSAAAALASMSLVALLAEGVDRNEGGEITKVKEELVALLAEGVDRNVQKEKRQALE